MFSEQNVLHIVLKTFMKINTDEISKNDSQMTFGRVIPLVILVLGVGVVTYLTRKKNNHP